MEQEQVIIREAINNDYEWIQYNKRLRIIHSIKDDMFQMKSIIEALGSNKLPKNWFENQQTKELLAEFSMERNSAPFENRSNIAPKLKGYYIHRLLVNAVAMWASPRYAIYIFELLDQLYRSEREKLENKIAEIKPRTVPKNKETSYKYMIYTEELPDDDDMILLHLVRRNTKTFQAVEHIRRSDKCWFYRESLPVSMTPNEDIKELIKRSFPEHQYDIKGTTILTYKDNLDNMMELITEYFDHFQD